MASKYLQKYPVPASFQQILADFTRQVLRDQPPNIIEYAAKYFEMLEKGEKFQFNSKYNVAKEDKNYHLAYNPKNAEEITKKASNIANKVQNKQPENKQSRQNSKPVSNRNLNNVQEQPASPSQLPPRYTDHVPNLPQELAQEFGNVFSSLDLNKNGYIESKQLKKAAYDMAAFLGSNEPINDQQIEDFVNQFENGRISQKQFFTFLSQIHAPLIQAFGQPPSASLSTPQAPQIGTQKTVNQQEVQNYIENQEEELANEQFRQLVNKIFDQIDVNGNGYIQSRQIANAVQNFFGQLGGDAQPDQNQVNEFVAQVDSNHDGKISKDEFYNFLTAVIGSGVQGQLQAEGEAQGEAEGEEQN